MRCKPIACLVYALAVILAGCAAALRKPLERVPGDFSYTREFTELVVEPLSDTEALLLGPLAGAGEMIRVVMIDGVEMWRYSGYLF